MRARIDPTNAVVAAIGDEEIALGVERQAAREQNAVDVRTRGRAAIS
jgi:hypothetical protein